MAARLRTLARLLRRSREVLRKEGFGSLWFKTLAATGLYRRLAVYEWFATVQVPRRSLVRFECVFLRDSDIDDYCRLRPDAMPEELAERFRRGDRCFAARAADGRLMAVV